jgi:hypothetical protein
MGQGVPVLEKLTSSVEWKELELLLMVLWSGAYMPDIDFIDVNFIFIW